MCALHPPPAKKQQRLRTAKPFKQLVATVWHVIAMQSVTAHSSQYRILGAIAQLVVYHPFYICMAHRRRSTFKACFRRSLHFSPPVISSQLLCLGSCRCAPVAHSPAVMFSLVWCLGSCPCVPVAHSWGDRQQKCSTTIMPKFLPAQPRGPLLTSSNVLLLLCGITYVA